MVMLPVYQTVDSSVWMIASVNAVNGTSGGVALLQLQEFREEDVVLQMNVLEERIDKCLQFLHHQAVGRLRLR